MDRLHRTMAAAIALLLSSGTGCALDPESADSPDFYEGVQFDSDNPNASVGGGKEDGPGYEVPTNLPDLVDPEIIVSLDGLTLHLFDRHTGFSEVFPVGVGVLNSDGLSVTPTGHFATGPDTGDGWYYIARRRSPSYFAGFPFIRLDAENSRGQHTYGLHGPITETLIRGYVSHGCIRIEGEDVVRIFYLIRNHPSTPVTIQREVEHDQAGDVVDLGTDVTLWAVGETIDYGSSVGDAPPRDDTGTDADGCADDRLESDSPVPVEAGTLRGLIMCADDRDLYTVELAAGQTLTASIHFVHQISDLDMRILDESGATVATSAGSTDDETATVTAEEAGTFTIEIYPYASGDNNGYSLAVAID